MVFLRKVLEVHLLVLIVCMIIASHKFGSVRSQGLGELLKRGFHHRPIAKRTLESYKECKKIGPNPKDPEALLMVEGNKLVLTCQVCLSPSSTSSGIWKRLLPDTATFIPVRFDGRQSRLLSDLSLEITNIREKDSGIYFCFLGPNTMAKYAVDVVQLEPHRYKLDPFVPSKPVDTQILNEFKKGIPCRSSLLPKGIRDLSIIHNMKSEFMIGFCKIPCPSGAGIVVVTDKNGAVLDTVDNSQGFYSMHQPLPDLPALVKRTTIYEEVGKSVILSCPGNRKSSFMIWRNDSYVIDPSKVHVLTKGRVIIDLGNNLHIRQLRFSDSAIYSCWDDKVLVGTIRLQTLAKSAERSYRIYVLNTGIIFTFLTIFMVALTVCKNSRLQTKE